MNDKKEYTTIADLLTDISFLAWHLEGNERDADAWNHWIAEMPAHAALTKQAILLLDVFINLKKEKLSDYQVNASFDRVFKKLHKQEQKFYTFL